MNSSNNNKNPQNPSALCTRGLGFSYGKTVALDNISIAVPAGRFVALLGPNGAGKTTFFSLVTGLYCAAVGNISVSGFDLRRQTLQALAGMGVVFQRSTLDTDLSVLQNLHYAAALQGIARAEAARRIETSLHRHALADLGGRKVNALSGGQRRQVELARALLHQPDILLLDEPTVGLDLQSRSEFVRHVRQLCSEQGTGVLWATHLMDEVGEDDLVYLLQKGRIIASGEVAGLKTQHQVETVAQLFTTLLDSGAAQSQPAGAR